MLGVIELASVTPFTQIQKDFLQLQIAETIGDHVNTIVGQHQTEELLASRRS
ncbi:histidine kinase OS=Streptomyces tendae OX=1932 GN=GUR47_36185 PE=4 SV=1 [Streptomyces tendae]